VGVRPAPAEQAGTDVPAGADGSRSRRGLLLDAGRFLLLARLLPGYAAVLNEGSVA